MNSLFEIILTFVFISLLICPLISLVGGKEKGIGCLFSFLSFFAVGIVILVGGLLLSIAGNQGDDRGKTLLPIAIGIELAALVGIGAFQWYVAITNYQSGLDDKLGLKCPKCGKRGGKRNYTSGDYYLTTETETKTVRHYDSDHNLTGESEYEHEVPTVARSVYSWAHCPSCQHTWK